MWFVLYFKGFLHPSWAGGACTAVAQWDTAVWVRSLRENLRTRRELGSAQSGSLAGRPRLTKLELERAQSHFGGSRPTLLTALFHRRGASAVKYAGKASSAPPRSQRTCSSIPTLGLIRASTAGRGSTRSQTWRNTRSSTQVRLRTGSASNRTAFVSLRVKRRRADRTVSLLLQVRSRTSVRCAGRPSARARISSRTAGSTRASNLLAVTSAGKASRGKWTCGDTRRRNTAWNDADAEFCTEPETEERVWRPCFSPIYCLLHLFIV